MPIREMAAVRHPYLLSQVVVDRHAARHGFCDDGLHDLRRYLFTRCRVHRVHLWLHLAYNHTSKFGTSELSSRPGSGYSSRSLRSTHLTRGSPFSPWRLSAPRRLRL